MTETVATEAPAVDPNAGLDEFGQMLKGRLKASIEEYNALASRVKAATGDPSALLDNLRENYTEDETVVKITAKIEEIDNQREALWNKRDEILKPIVAKIIEDGKSGLGDAEEKAADVLKTVNSGRKYLTEIAGGDHVLADLPPVVGKRVARAGGGTSEGTGARRVRGFDVFIDGTLATAKDAQGNDKSNLAAAAKALGVDTEDLRKQFFEAAGSDDSKAWPAEVTFDVTVTEGEGDAAKSVTKHIVAKRVIKAATNAPAVSAAANQDSQTA